MTSRIKRECGLKSPEEFTRTQPTPEEARKLTPKAITKRQRSIKRKQISLRITITKEKTSPIIQSLTIIR
jgi:hypothetical protein